jgi:hypothetical protein
MKIKELIEYLQTLNPEHLVVIPGYEGGFEDIKIESIKEIELELNVNVECYYGPHEKAGPNVLVKSKAYIL